MLDFYNGLIKYIVRDDHDRPKPRAVTSYHARYLATSKRFLPPISVLCQGKIKVYYFIIGIRPLGRFGQRPELSQATGIALLRCILGKFLGVVCHSFPPLLDVPTFVTRCLHVRHDAINPSGGRWNCGRECCPVILPKWRLPRHLGTFYMPQIYDMGPTALLPLRRKACWALFFALKNPTASAGFEPANLGSKGQNATPRPPKHTVEK